jgi:dUTP pyrophosphatase
MSNVVGKFEKVSLEQYIKDKGDNNKSSVEFIYSKIKLPKRATVGSAGYDFYLPEDLILAPGETAKLPTGIKVKVYDGWMLAIFPRSGLGFKYKMQIYNTVGIIDSDYYNNDNNEGHIFMKIYNDSKDNKTIELKAGDAFCQGIFIPYGITEDDYTDCVRNGGFGSTSN